MKPRAVNRPWDGKFLGYSMTWHKIPQLKVAQTVERRLRNAVKEINRKGRGRRAKDTIVIIVPKLRGFAAYYQLVEVKLDFERNDEWLQHRLRAIIWQQWKRTCTGAKKKMQRGLDEERV